MTKEKPFWETKTLAEMTTEEWESVCDGCGLCCLTKLQDDETDQIVYTRVVCKYSDLKTGACSDYQNRSINVPTCVNLTLDRVAEFDWLPDTCAYRVLYRGDPLPEWHPLVSGKKESVTEAHVGLLAIPVVVDQPGLDYGDCLMKKLKGVF
ncbi:MAG: YcgN family cysteine cluster protein [Hydrogenovibrio crunogenus]|nr:YcgN family cysteine cluster protein [Hydrogenovibrio crunogenus]